MRDIRMQRGLLLLVKAASYSEVALPGLAEHGLHVGCQQKPCYV